MTAPNEPTRYLSVADLAARWGEHPNTVYKRVATREWLEAVRTIQHGRQLRFLERDVDAYDEARRLTPTTIVAALGVEPEVCPTDPDGPIEDEEPPAAEFGPRRPPVARKAAA